MHMPFAATVENEPMIEEIRELFQTILVPQLEGIKGELKAVNTRIDALETKLDARIETLDAKIGGIDTKVESYRRELVAEIRRVEDTLSADFVRIESKVDVRLATMNDRLESLRRELLAEIKASR
jgi:hypothetical protein